MNHATLLIGPQAIGKTRHAAMFMAAIGATTLIDDWDGCSAIPAGALAISNEQAAAMDAPSGTVVYRVNTEAEIILLSGLLTAYHAITTLHPDLDLDAEPGEPERIAAEAIVAINAALAATRGEG